jgi:hypothetical protein
MTPETNQQNAPKRVSIFARIIPALSYALPAIGAVFSALLYMNVMRALRNAESAGIAAVAGGMSEANLVMIVALYFGIFVGIAGVIVSLVRCFTDTRTSSPSSWFFVITGLLGVAPILPLVRAQNLLIEGMFAMTGFVEVARQINLCLILTIVAGLVICVILLIASVVPLPALLKAKRKYAPVIVLVLMEFALIVVVVIYHLHNHWLYNVKMGERF